MNNLILLGIDISKDPFDYIGSNDSSENVQKVAKLISFGTDWFSLMKVISIVGLLISFVIIIIRIMIARSGAERGEHKQIIGIKFLIFLVFCSIGTVLTVAVEFAKAFM